MWSSDQIGLGEDTPNPQVVQGQLSIDISPDTTQLNFCLAMPWDGEVGMTLSIYTFVEDQLHQIH